jgi:hypothetical protein
MVTKPLRLSLSVFVTVFDEEKRCGLCRMDDLAVNSGHKIVLQALEILKHWPLRE